MNPILFLDIDGVLNDHKFDEAAQSCRIDPECVGCFNRILERTKCDVVLSSAWRYMIIGGSMDLSGFSYMLRTHGVHVGITARLIGHTAKDREMVPRGVQIREWVDHHKPTVWAVVDDLQADMEAVGGWLVRTDPTKGMTLDDAERLIAMLNSPFKTQTESMPAD